MSALGGVCSGGVCSGGICSGGVSAPGGVCSRGVSARGGVCSGGCGIPACTEADTLTPPVNRMTNSSKNITLATTSLRPVKIEDFWNLLLINILVLIVRVLTDFVATGFR